MKLTHKGIRAKMLNNYYNMGVIDLFAGTEVVIEEGQDISTEAVSVWYPFVRKDNGKEFELSRVVYTKDLEICNGTGELSEVKPKADVKFIGRDSAYEGKYNYLKDCLVSDEIAQLENISARLKKDGHKYLVINTTGGEFIWTVK